MRFLLSLVLLLSAYGQTLPSMGESVTGNAPAAAPTRTDLCSSPLGPMLPECKQASQPETRPRSPVIRPDSTNRGLPQGREGTSPVAANEEMIVRPAEPPAPPSEFQNFAMGILGERLTVFGSDLFENAPSTFAPVDRIPVPANYVVGPGDEIQIRSWGQVNLDTTLTVDRTGTLFVPQLGEVRVAGLEARNLQPFLQAQMSRLFRNFELAVSLGHLRSIQIYVVGAARRPGSYTVSSLSTLVSAIFASGGPSTSGSMRGIELRREGKTVVAFDLYDLLVRGDKSADQQLLPGDVIHFQSVGSQVAIGGSIRRKGVFELHGETHLSDLVKLAGGASPVADLSRVEIERITSDGQRAVGRHSLRAPGEDPTLQSGDLVRLVPVSPRVRDSVSLRGNVAMPGKFPFFSGMRLRDLIPHKEALITREYWQHRNQRSFMASESLAPETEPGTEPAHRPVELKQSIPDINWSYAIIERKDPSTLAQRLIPFHPGKLLLNGDESQNLLLEPDDVVTIFSQADFNVPIADQTRSVEIDGEVKMAGRYTLNPGDTLGDLIQRAGGLTGEAYPEAIFVTRESVRKAQAERLDSFLQKLNADLEHAGQDMMNASLAPSDLQDAAMRQSQQRKIVENLRSVRASGRLVLPMRSEGGDLARYSEVALENDDRIHIPFRPGVVHVLGEVTNASSFVQNSSMRVRDYIALAGGFSRYADSGKAFLILCDGTVQARKNRPDGKKFEELTLHPGDAIVVPPKLSKSTLIRGLRDWSQVFSQFALGAAAINILKN